MANSAKCHREQHLIEIWERKEWRIERKTSTKLHLWLHQVLQLALWYRRIEYDEISNLTAGLKGVYVWHAFSLLLYHLYIKFRDILPGILNNIQFNPCQFLRILILLMQLCRKFGCLWVKQIWRCGAEDKQCNNNNHYNNDDDDENHIVLSIVFVSRAWFPLFSWHKTMRWYHITQNDCHKQSQ